MTEYIEREAVLRETYKAQDELESNDDKVWRRNKPYFKGLAWANRIILDTPAADVVEVTRCKDCVSFVKRDGFCWCEEHSDGFGSHIVYVDEDDYCSFGERKDA